jgi:hypothetical protein
MICIKCNSTSFREDDPGELQCNTCGVLTFSKEQMRKVLTSLAGDVMMRASQKQRENFPEIGVANDNSL